MFTVSSTPHCQVTLTRIHCVCLCVVCLVMNDMQQKTWKTPTTDACIYMQHAHLHNTSLNSTVNYASLYNSTTQSDALDYTYIHEYTSCRDQMTTTCYSQLEQAARTRTLRKASKLIYTTEI